VVEFEYRFGEGRVASTGIICPSSGSLWHNGEGIMKYGSVNDSSKKNYRKTGHLAINPGMKMEEARKLAEAYFAKTPQVTPQVKVGDLVEIFSDNVFADGTVCMVYAHGASDGSQWVRDRHGRSNFCYSRQVRPLSGTYAERQAKWIEFHGLKVGDKVKVVRKFKEYQDGFGSCQWDFTTQKASMQGQVYSIAHFPSHNEWVCLEESDFPYFALEPVK
jgi:hypothetical protein